MKKILSYITICALAAVTFAGCAKDAGVDGGKDGEGRVIFDMKFNGEVRTRAETPDNVVVKIANATGIIYKYESLAEVPAQLWLVADNYTISVEGGTKMAYGWDTPYYVGKEAFTVQGGVSTTVTVDCLIQNALFGVEFDATVTDVLTDYSVTLFPVNGNNAKTIVFDEDNTEAVAYVMLEDGQTTMDWTFAAHHDKRGDVTKSGTLTGLQARKKYVLGFKYTIIERTGEFQLNVTVDETTVDYGHNIHIYQRPKLTGIGFDLAETQSQSARYEISALASSDIASIVLSGSVFNSGYNILDSANDPSDFGVEVNARANNRVTVYLTPDLFDMVPEGLNNISITVTDANERVTTVVFKYSTIAVSVNPIARKDTWATFATVTGTMLQEGVTAVRIAYKTPEGDWQYADATETTNGQYSAKVTGLTPSTEYQTRIEIDGTLEGPTVSFTTEAATPLPNGGFENWHQNSDVWYANAQTADKFWDSGNEGAVKAPAVGSPNNNITTGENDPRPGSSGQKSAKLKSSWFGVLGMGAFAAGNIYSGNFIEARANLSNPSGRVEFGRPWSEGTRPSAMSVWYKATLGNVNYAKSGAPLTTGQKDKFQILIAFADSGFPYTVDTADWGTLVNYETDPRILAYGSLVGEADVAEWTQHTIPLKYRSLDRVPTHIIVVASASMYGDYFTGSTSSVLCIDDFELIYNDNIVLQD